MAQIEGGDRVRHKTNLRINQGLNFEVREVENDKARCAFFDEQGKETEEWFDVSELVLISKSDGGFLN